MNEHPNIVGNHNVEYDFATAPTIKVPGDWNTQVPQLFNYEGVLWYQRDFDAQPKPGTRTFLHIGAANYRSHVWVNQKRVCDHEGGFTPFDCEVTGSREIQTTRSEDRPAMGPWPPLERPQAHLLRREPRYAIEGRKARHPLQFPLQWPICTYRCATLSY